jgi:hypothetical protein
MGAGRPPAAGTGEVWAAYITAAYRGSSRYRSCRMSMLFVRTSMHLRNTYSEYLDLVRDHCGVYHGLRLFTQALPGQLTWERPGYQKRPVTGTVNAPALTAAVAFILLPGNYAHSLRPVTFTPSPRTRIQSRQSDHWPGSGPCPGRPGRCLRRYISSSRGRTARRRRGTTGSSH